MRNSETLLLGSFARYLKERLPRSWKVRDKLGGLAGRLSLKGPDGVAARLAVTVIKRLYPKDVSSVVDRLREKGKKNDQIVIIADYLAPRTRELLTNAGAGYWDNTGNLYLALERPALHIDVAGKSKNPSPDTRSLRSLRGRAAGRAVRALCDFCPPFGIRELATRSGVPAPTLSRVVDLLERDAIVRRGSPRGGIIHVDWQALIRRWARDYDFVKSNQTAAYLEPRGLVSLLDKLRRAPQPYAVTGTLAADAVGAAVTAPRLATVFATDVQGIADQLKLRLAESGGNVLLAEPYNPVALERTNEKEGLIYAAPSQVAVDLLTGSGRSPADGEALLTWMKDNGNAWRS